MTGRLMVGILALLCLTSAGEAAPLWRLGFYWSPAANTYPPQNVPWSKYTHVSQIGILPTKNCAIDDTTYATDKVSRALVAHAHDHGAKVLITLVEDQDTRAIVTCTTPGRIAAFVTALAAYVRENNYDGLDLDWEHNVVPSQYQDLVRRLRTAMPKSILTADITVDQRGYLVGVQEHLDRVNIMNYDMSQGDYHGNLLTETWHHAALLSGGDIDEHQTAEANVRYAIDSGLAPGKINLGLPFYGYVVQGCQKGFETSVGCKQGLTGPLQSVGSKGIRKTQIEYNRVMADYGKGRLLWDTSHKTPYIAFAAPPGVPCRKEPCPGDAFVTYADPRQMTEAVTFLLDNKLGGIMAFALHQEFMADDTGDARYPLSSAIYHAMTGRDPLQ